ncbi:MAG: type II toxin-antitoxin system VapB family antitoxin [Pseudomonadota bacterium]|nr:type II toxin-antitoxin system VapB family antitoxin [Pseudomonadota bacterium]
MSQTAKLFKNGHSQAVRLPKEYRFDGNEVEIRRVGDSVVLTPLVNRWKAMFEQLDKLGFSEDFMVERDQPAEQERPALEELFR